jgi:selenocysteine lyase/cysteine desulfurase
MPGVLLAAPWLWQCEPIAERHLVTDSGRPLEECVEQALAYLLASQYPHRIRISPPVYNDMADIERFLEALTS